MKLRCSQCDHVGQKNDFLVPSDIMPPNICKCPSCGQTNENFFIHREVVIITEELEDWILSAECSSVQIELHQKNLERALTRIKDIIQSSTQSMKEED